jgi:cell division protein FtsQ
LQQVSTRAFASAVPIDPAQFPALVPAPRRRNLLGSGLINFGRVRVLYRRRLKQGVAAAVVLAALMGVYEAREQIGALWGNLYDLGERGLAHSQFAISRISMSGQAMTSEQEILAALDIKPETSMVNFDVDAARAAIEKLPAIAEATIRKTYPNQLFISIKERVPVARWRVDGVTYAIDATGARITDDGDAFPKLPLVVGDEAADDAMVMIRAMAQYPAIENGVEALSRIGARRWDIIYKTGLRVQLPEQGVAQALAQLATLEDHFKVLERDVTVVDLRVPGVVAVKPSDDAVKQLQQIAKDKIAHSKGNFKEDADYSAPQ